MGYSLPGSSVRGILQARILLEYERSELLLGQFFSQPQQGISDMQDLS